MSELKDEDGVPIKLIDRTEANEYRAHPDFIPVVKYAARKPMGGEIGCMVVDREVEPVFINGKQVGTVRSGGRTLERIVVA